MCAWRSFDREGSRCRAPGPFGIMCYRQVLTKQRPLSWVIGRCSNRRSGGARENAREAACALYSNSYALAALAVAHSKGGSEKAIWSVCLVLTRMNSEL